MADMLGREERRNMEEAAKAGTAETDFREKLERETGDSKFANTYKVRGRLYDSLNLSMDKVDAIIIVTSVLIVVAIIVGILIGK